jgi:hypothetical protein
MCPIESTTPDILVKEFNESIVIVVSSPLNHLYDRTKIALALKVWVNLGNLHELTVILTLSKTLFVFPISLFSALIVNISEERQKRPTDRPQNAHNSSDGRTENSNKDSLPNSSSLNTKKCDEQNKKQINAGEENGRNDPNPEQNIHYLLLL